MGSAPSAPHPRHGIAVGHVLGVAIVVQPLWIAIVALLTWSLAEGYFPEAAPGISPAAATGLGLLSALLLFGGILLHELGHAIVARRHGIEVDEVDLWLLGGVARLRGEPQQARDELAFAAAGPAVTAVLLTVVLAARLVLPEQAAWFEALLDYQVFATTAILVLNLLPAFPLDGGRILRAALWLRSGRRARATELAASVGRGFAILFIALGAASVLAGGLWGLWEVAIGMFLLAAGRAEQEHERVNRALAGLSAGDVVRGAPVSISEADTLADAVRTHFARHLYTAFPVIDAQGTAVGLLTIAQVKAVLPRDRPLRTVGVTAIRDPALIVDAVMPVADVVARPAFAEFGRAVVVDSRGRAMGMLSVTDLERAMRAQDLLAASPPSATDSRRSRTRLSSCSRRGLSRTSSWAGARRGSTSPVRCGCM